LNIFFNGKPKETKKKIAILIIIWIFLLLIIFFTKPVLMPFLLALLISYVINPIIVKICSIKLKKYKFPKSISIIIVYLLIFILIILLFIFIIPQIYIELIKFTKDLAIISAELDENKIYALTENIKKKILNYNIPIDIIFKYKYNHNNILEKTDYAIAFNYNDFRLKINIFILFKKIIKQFLHFFSGQSSNIAIIIRYTISEAFHLIFQFILILMLTAFILIDIKKIKLFLFYLAGMNNNETFNIFIKKIDYGLSGVVRGQLLICLINAIFTIIGLLILNIKFAFILATIAGIFSIVPIFGSIISTIPIVAIALTQSFSIAILSFLWIIFIHAIEANILNPKIMGNASKIHPIFIVLALLSGKHFYGIIGALFAVPIASIVTTIFKSLILKTRRKFI
jgi:predicted PurR-regulated permease PerM